MGKLTRFENWPELLYDYFLSCTEKKFSWGEFDCCLFAADAVKVMTGEDGAEGLRGNYATKEEALSLLDTVGGLEAHVTGFLGEPVTPGMAGRGDVVLKTEDDMDALGICDGTMAIFAGPRGLSYLPLTSCRMAWKV